MILYILSKFFIKPTHVFINTIIITFVIITLRSHVSIIINVIITTTHVYTKHYIV